MWLVAPESGYLLGSYGWERCIAAKDRVSSHLDMSDQIDASIC